MSDIGKSHCADIGGTCITERDGYYIVSALCVGLGALILVLFVTPTARRLQGKQLFLRATIIHPETDLHFSSS